MGSDASGRTSLGTRNNNPGNIKAGNTLWRGQTGENKGFCTFDTPADGVRAIRIILQTYQNIHGLVTVDEMIPRWSATDQADYVRNVCKAMDLEPEEPFFLRNNDYLFKMVKAICRQENGFDPYSDDDLKRWLA